MQVSTFDPKEHHGFVLLMDMTVGEHQHGDDYDYILELSKASPVPHLMWD